VQSHCMRPAVAVAKFGHNLSFEPTGRFERSSTVHKREGSKLQVKRIVANFAVLDLSQARAFYQDVLGLELLMNHGWIQTYGSQTEMTIQVSFAAEGGSGAPVPDLSIEVDDVDAALERTRAAGFSIEYGPADEPWGVRRFFLRDPFGKLVNILAHI
jgi:catechol 2,3-dioxygenase-like lactoylglutathione lyase family enzyme